jgi:hypothetical protein
VSTEENNTHLRIFVETEFDHVCVLIEVGIPVTDKPQKFSSVTQQKLPTPHPVQVGGNSLCSMTDVGGLFFPIFWGHAVHTCNSSLIIICIPFPLLSKVSLFQ